MQKFTIAVASLAVMATMLVTTIHNRSAAISIGRAEGFSHAVMPIDELTTAAAAEQRLPNQSFDAF